MLKQSVWDKARQITGYFEGWISGNFDGQYLSYGYLQWNFGQGTLQPLFKRLFNEYSGVASSILPDGGNTLKAALDDGTEKNWALSIQRNNVVVDPWLAALRNLYNSKEFITIMNDAAVWYKDKAISMCQAFNLKTDRAFCLAFDIAVQNGGLGYYEMAETEYISRLTSWAVVAAQRSNPRWQDDVKCRKMAIVAGAPYAVGNSKKGWPTGVTFTDTDAFEEEWLDWQTILKNVTNSPDGWIKGITSITKFAQDKENAGELEIFQYLPALIEKVYNKRTGTQLGWEEILAKMTDKPDDWHKGIDTIVNMANAQGDIGDLEIFKYIPTLIEKINNQ